MMPIQIININESLNWVRPQGQSSTPYCFSDKKGIRVDKNWAKRHCIYRWIKQSTGEVAYVGETERSLSERVNNYTSAKPNSSAGQSNQRVYKEHQDLKKNNDYLYLEFIDSFNGYNLTNNRERIFAEKIIIGISKPYLQ